MMLNLILAVDLKDLVLNIVMSVLLIFGSLLWPISIVAVIWGFFQGFIPAIQKREFIRGSVILLILLITCIIIVISLQKAVYLTAYFVPVILVYVYIKRYVHPRSETLTDFRNN